MCGIFALFSNDQRILNRVSENSGKIVSTIQNRGPDCWHQKMRTDFFSIHTLLSMTGFGEQPVVNDEFVLVFNGEIYNDFENYNDSYGDTTYLETRLTSEGIEALDDLDGEYAICVKCRNSNELYVKTDSFGTKPLHYMLGNDFCAVGSYRTTVGAAGLSGEIHELPSRTKLVFDLTRFKLEQNQNQSRFDFTSQTNTVFDDWNRAFSRAIRKRTSSRRERIFVSLSAGHDSGLICAELLAQDIPFKVFTVPYLEDQNVLNKRLEILEQEKIPFEIIEQSRDEFNLMKIRLMNEC